MGSWGGGGRNRDEGITFGQAGVAGRAVPLVGRVDNGHGDGPVWGVGCLGGGVSGMVVQWFA